MKSACARHPQVTFSAAEKTPSLDKKLGRMESSFCITFFSYRCTILYNSHFGGKPTAVIYIQPPNVADCSVLTKSWHHNRRFREREKSSAADFRYLLKKFSILKENFNLKLNLVIVVWYFGKFLNWKSQVHAEWIWQISCLPCLSVARVIRVTEKSKWQHIYLYVKQINALSLSFSKQHCFLKFYRIKIILPTNYFVSKFCKKIQ